MIYKSIGDYVRLIDVRNEDGKVTNLLGINITKNFMPSVANISETDLTRYKIIGKNQFAYSPMQVGRDETIRIALYESDDLAIISPAYLVIEVINEKALSPKYMMMCFQRAESDRYGWFISDSTVRASLDWDRFCEIKIPIPDIENQNKFAKIYELLISKRKSYHESALDLQRICDSYIEALGKTHQLKTLEHYIEQVDERNNDKKISLVQGVSISKKFIKTKANMSGVDIDDYKVVKKGYFAFNPNTARMGDKICVALNLGEQCVVSKIYPVFKVIDESLLLPEYLLLCFTRSEFDRYARFHSWGSARETFDWADMLKVKLPIPDIKIQKAIVSIYKSLESRNKILEDIEKQIKKICPVLISGLINELHR